MKTTLKVISMMLTVLLIFGVFSVATPVVAADLQLFLEKTKNQDNNEITAKMTEETSEESVEAVPSVALSEAEDKREQYVKHFKMSDGTYKAAQYDTPVHYLDKEGNWVDYDNTLTQTDSDTERSIFARDFINTQSDVEIRLSKKTNGSKLVRMKTEDFSVSWNFQDIKKKTGKVTEQIADDGDPTTLEKLNSEVVYENVFENVDLQYILTSGFLKENIILKDKDVVTEFYVNYKNPNLTAKLYDEKTVALCDDEDNAIFVINAPFMQDSEGHTSDGITLSITESKNGQFTLKMTLDEEWLNSEGIVYPVTVDPIMTTSQKWNGTSTCDSAFVAAGYPDTTFGRNGLHPEGSLYVGYEESFTSQADRGAVRSFLKCNLPQLDIADKVVDAKLYLYLRGSSTSNSVNIYKVISSWQSNTVSWNNQPAVDDYLKIDYLKMILWQEHEWKIWEITDLVRGWYNGDIANHGIMLKSDFEADGSGRAWFYSDYYTTTSAARPFLVISYRNMSGYEDYYSYTNLSAGRGGVASVNNYNGNFVYSQYLTEDCGGEIMPVNISLVYNSNKANENYANLGNGAQTNYHLFIKPNPNINSSSIDEEKKYKYYLIDADGTEHYFYFEDLNGATGKDEDGLGYELWVNPESNNSSDLKWVKYKVTDKDKNTMEFNRYGWLIKITSSIGKQINIDHEFQPNTENLRIKYIWDGVGRCYTFVYNDANLISSITDPAYRVTAFTYNGSNLGNITFPDGKTVSFHQTYYGNLWDHIYAPDKFTVIAYKGNSVQMPVEAIGNFTYGDLWLDYNTFDYKQNETYVTDIQNRKYTYQFNDYGQTTGIVSNNSGQAQFFSYAPGNSTSANANKLNTSSKIQTSTVNYLRNPSFSSGLNDDYWQYNTSPAGTYSVTADWGAGHFDYGSAKISKWANGGITSIVQTVGEVPSGVYTLSAYATTAAGTFNGTGFLVLEIWNGETRETGYVLDVFASNIWDKNSLTVEVGEGKALRVLAGIGENSTGEMWFDDIQLESGYGATSFNLLENAGFKNQGNRWGLLNSNYNFSEHISECAVTTLGADEVPGQSNAFYSRATSARASNFIYQRVNVNGKKGDVFSIGGWARAASAPLNNGTKPENESPNFDIAIEFYGPNGFINTVKNDFNPDVDSWQFNSFMAIAPEDYSFCIYYIGYNRNINNLYFTGAYCYKETYGQTYTYDDNGNIVSSQDLAKTESSFAYSNNQMTKLLNPSGSRYMYSYDEQNKLFKAISSDGQNYNFAYDSNGNVTDTYISPLKPATNIWDGKQYFIVNAGTGKALDSGEGEGELTLTGYTHYGTEKQMWFPVTTSNEYNGIYQLISRGRTGPTVNTGADVFIHVSEHSNEKGNKLVTTTDYDYTKQYLKFVKNSDNTFTIYTLNSNYTKCLNCENGEGFTNGIPNNAVFEATCDPNNLKETMKWYFYEVPSGTEKYLSTHASYTENGNFTAAVNDVNNSTTSYAYNEYNGLLTETTDPVGVKTYYTYNTNNNQMSSVYSCGAISAYDYDNVGRLSKITSSADTGVNNLEYNFTYDEYGRLQTISVGGQPLMTTTYDQYHRPTVNTYGNNQYFTTYYDKLDRISAIWYNTELSKCIFYLYADNGNLAVVIDRFSNTKTHYTYDLSGRVVDVKTYSAITLNNYSTLCDWVKYLYEDKTNYLVGMTHWTPETGTQIYEYVYGDEALGQMPDQVYTVKLNGQVVQSYAFDELGRQTAKTIPLADGNVFGHYYAYKDLYDNRSSTQVERFENRLGTYTFTYDVRGNITKESFVPWSNFPQSYEKNYIYDALNQLVWYEDTFGNYYAYAYDKAGNIVNEEYVNPQDQYSIKHYTYDNANWRDLLKSYDGESIVYDEIGNPTTYRGATLSWSEGRRLASYSKNGQLLSFQYDADGKRISKNVNGTVYNYIYNQGTLVGISNNGILLKFICDEKGDYVGFIQGGLTYYYVRNLQNDVVGISDTSGNVLVTYSYDPWGKLISIDGYDYTWLGELNPIRYRGYFYDSETGLYYLQSRYYDPETNRFINADEASVVTVSPDSATYDKNLYAYCDNNPVVRRDNGGDFWESAFDVISLGASIIEVCVNPTDIWAWAGLVGDAVDLVPFVTGVGEVTRAVKTTVKVVDKSADVLDTANDLYKAADTASDIRKATGSYEIVYKSGKNYIGKGSFSRAMTSAKKHADNADDILAIRWKSAPTSRDAFIDEFLMQKRAGGVLSFDKELLTHNKIWSPGRKYYGR